MHPSTPHDLSSACLLASASLLSPSHPSLHKPLSPPDVWISPFSFLQNMHNKWQISLKRFLFVVPFLIFSSIVNERLAAPSHSLRLNVQSFLHLFANPELGRLKSQHKSCAKSAGGHFCSAPGGVRPVHTHALPSSHNHRKGEGVHCASLHW